MTKPKTYVKKPVIIEARQFAAESDGPTIAAWCGGRFDQDAKPSDHTDVRYSIAIPTLEGVMTADLGDYIIRGIKGEFYPCKPDIFRETYSELDGQE